MSNRDPSNPYKKVATPADSAPINTQPLALKIEEWLTLSQQTASPELKQFMGDLRTNSPEVRKWAGASFERLLPLRYPRSTWTAWGALIRNVLIFLPILLTWWSLFNATRKFAELREANPKRDLNFLLVWQRDLHGIDRLSTVALIDAFVILLLIALSMWVGWSEEFRDTKHVKRIEEQHAGLMVALERDLAGYRHLSLSDLNGIVATTLTNLSAVAQGLSETARLLESTTEAASRSITTTEKVTLDRVDKLVAQLDGTIKGLDAASGIHQGLVHVVQAAQQQLTESTAKLDTGLQTAVANLQNASQSLTLTMDGRLDALNQQITAALASVQSGTTQVLDTIRQDFSAAAQNLQASAVRTSGEVNSSIVPAIQSSAAALADASDKIAQLVREVDFGLAKIYETISSIERLR